MAEPRYKQYVRKTEVKKSPSDSRKLSRGCMVFFVFAFLLAVAVMLVMVAPAKNSLMGNYIIPENIRDIVDHTQARWVLHDAHRRQLEASMSWYFFLNGKSPQSLEDLESTGLSLFLFNDQEGRPVVVSTDPAILDQPENEYLLVISPGLGSQGGIYSRRTMQNENVMGKTWNVPQDSEYLIDIENMLRRHHSELGANPHLSDSYAAFLAEFWESASNSYASLYRKIPSGFDEVTENLGLEPNPDCVWPFTDESPLTASCEAGSIDNRYFYWEVTLSSGRKYGRAWEWDYFIPSAQLDRPMTPEEISGTVGIVNLSEISGTRRIIFTDETVHETLINVQPQPEEQL